MLALLIPSITLAQPPSPDEGWIESTYVIAGSTRDFASALATAATVAEGTGYPLDLHGVRYDPAHKRSSGGLTYAPSVCEDLGGYPCYVARGRHGTGPEGPAVSIEWSGAIQGFTPDLYVVVVAESSTPDQIAEPLRRAKAVIADAYAKTAPVYQGCMH